MNKRGIVWQTLIPWIIAIVVLSLGLIIYGTLTGKLGGLADLLGSFVRSG